MSSHFPIFLILLLFVLAETSISSVDPKFEACQPKTCGNEQTITYPFYIIGKQEPFCGNPGFELTCNKNGFPLLNLINTDYIVQEIFYNNHTIRVSNPVFSNPTTSDFECVAPAQNLTVGKYRFQVASNQRDLFLFYGCDLTSVPEWLKKKRIGCYAENRTSSVLALDREDPSLGIARRSCRNGVVNVTVEDDKGGVQEALRKGFVLNWNASTCSACTRSGGKCGFDLDSDIYVFRCYCRDRPHAANCDPESEKTSRKSMVIIATTVSAAVGIGVIIVIIYCYRMRSWSHKLNGLWKDRSKAHQDFETFLRNHGPLVVRRYSYLEIKKMTNSFAEKLGQGGYGGVFKGKIHGEHLVDEQKVEVVGPIGETSKAQVTNIVGIGGITRSGRCYGPTEEEARKNSKEEEEEEFLKIMKQSEYDVMEQLKKTPARISLLSLVLT